MFMTASAGAGAGGDRLVEILVGEDHLHVVDFLEGNPDRPLITGRVYHAEQMPDATARRVSGSAIAAIASGSTRPATYSSIGLVSSNAR